MRDPWLRKCNVGEFCFSASDLMISFSTLNTIWGDSFPHPPCIIQYHPSNSITSPTIHLLCNLVSSSHIHLHFLKTCKPCQKMMVSHLESEWVVCNKYAGYRKEKVGYSVHFGSLMYPMITVAKGLIACCLNKCQHIQETVWWFPKVLPKCKEADQQPQSKYES